MFVKEQVAYYFSNALIVSNRKDNFINWKKHTKILLKIISRLQMKVRLLQSVPGHCRAHGGREDGGQRDGDTQVRGSIPFNPNMVIRYL
jgi:hypothetical protein